MGAIFRRELGAFFTSSIAYVYLAVFYAFSGYFFYASSLYSATTDMAGLFSTLFMIIVYLIPILTMKSFSEEKKQKTEQGLLTAPVSLGGIVLGKYFATLLMYIMGISIVFVYALILSYFGEVAWNIVIANYFALLLLGSAFIAVTMFISSLTENQVVAAVFGILTLMVLQLLDIIAGYIKIDFIANILNSLSFYNKYTEFTCGIFNLSSVIFYISTAVIFNFLTIRVFEKRRWS
ncbi:MAG: ABC transporter permease subunit [Clostridium sp.]|nr:ABC transporter permease subunit [Clostridium sp.]MCM1547467.1 ABC transporter permease subunit [Ruminococcus sp.]